MLIHTHRGSHTHNHVFKTDVLYLPWFSHTNAPSHHALPGSCKTPVSHTPMPTLTGWGPTPSLSGSGSKQTEECDQIDSWELSWEQSCTLLRNLSPYWRDTSVCVSGGCGERGGSGVVSQGACGHWAVSIVKNDERTGAVRAWLWVNKAATFDPWRPGLIPELMLISWGGGAQAQPKFSSTPGSRPDSHGGGEGTWAPLWC